MNQVPDVSLFIAFSAGLLSFVSPCVLPLVPSYITYITGVSFHELTGAESKSKLRWVTIFHSLLFISGFSTILIIILGIHFTGLITVPFLQMEKRFELRKKPLGYLGSFFVGIIFAAGWTPCIGPILSTILIYAGTAKNFYAGILLLSIYSMGLGVPFLLSSLAFNSFLSTFEKMKRYLRVITIVSGLFLIAIGILMLTDTFQEINQFLNSLANP
jgi:cytochrome c-type biogenesis protein